MANIGVFESEKILNCNPGKDGDKAVVIVHAKDGDYYAKYFWCVGSWRYQATYSKLPEGFGTEAAKAEAIKTETVTTGTVKMEPNPISTEPFPEESIEQAKAVDKAVNDVITERVQKLKTEEVRRFVTVMYCNRPCFCEVPGGVDVALGQRLSVEDNDRELFCAAISKPFESDMLSLEAAGNIAGMYNWVLKATGIVHIARFGGGPDV